ncbi:M23 family metallopeptidase [Sphingomonas corticis]|jgi:murein DD-endopeptidase MepM/ murein hydrolase activator NlpD|uniref:M23 family metallopeptidase n=1 Tax=Sphingomonas corticis TaxID=2722791 RepID=A0ABX1CH29_9SPHN|nr:M23 family metallopeptidase [Sphingomonas corticis]NJR77307.1 M23 family metallopeptidase [Sphingomonas corticis]
MRRGAGLLPLLLAACLPAGERPSPEVAEPAPAAVPPPQGPEPPVESPATGVSQLPAPRPAWEVRPVVADATPVAPTRLTVRAGETLRGIAARTGAGVEAIARANGLAPPYPLAAGQVLAVPGGRYHLVKPGQTGIAIARAYGVRWAEVVAANCLAEPFVLRVGQRVLIPGDAARRPSAAERAAAFTLDIDSILTGGQPAVAANRPAARPVATPRRVLPATTAVVGTPPSPGRFAWPVAGRLVRRFGPGASGERNDGVKIAVPPGTPVKAAADGEVAYVGDGIAALGGLVIVRHGGGWASIYGHAGKLLVRRGQAVKRGQTIALSGQSGYADRPELHFELRRGRTPVDPVGQLPRR